MTCIASYFHVDLFYRNGIEPGAAHCHMCVVTIFLRTKIFYSRRDINEYLIIHMFYQASKFMLSGVVCFFLVVVVAVFF